jgi:hypothetical protein
MVMYYPQGSKTHRRIEFELRHGEGIPPKTVIKSNGQWCEIDPISERIVNQKYGAKLDKERIRKRDTIVQIIAEEALQGRLYTSANQFSEAFENNSGLGGNKTIRDRISVLSTQGDIKFIKDAKHLGLPHIRSKNGLLCVKDMEFLNQDGEIIKLLPSHYKCSHTGAILPVENPNV